MRLLLAILLSAVISLTLLNAREYKFTSEQELQKIYSSTISSHFYKQKLHYFSTTNALKIAYKIFPAKNAKATIVIASGRAESMLKYKELIYDLNQNSYSVYILDHRGQGYSDRLLDDSQLGHIDDFFDYVLDLKYFVKRIVPKDKKMILFAHSMGGTVASLYAQTYKRDFDALVLHSPMHQPTLLSNYLVGFVCHLAQKYKTNPYSYVFTKRSYDDTKHEFEGNRFTHSKIRFELTKSSYEKEPRTKVGGPSTHWLAQACIWSKASVQNADKIEIPILLLQAGDEMVVNNKAQEEFCENAAQKCQLKRFEGAYHEMFVEKDSIRKEVLSEMLDFISKISR